jgi:SAM-dependent methyltransferase
VRAFTDDDAIFRERSLSYCPRCNSKARHRRIWLFLEEKTNLFSERLRLFEVSPKYSFSRRFKAMLNLNYFGADLICRPHISARMDLTAVPIRSGTFDAVICVHVLEEIMDDRKAMSELYRILKPGGWAVISVPTRMDQLTYEDPTITTPAERERAFGETAHVRIYGYDLVERLEECGFRVQVDLAENVPPQTREKYGLRNDENIFFCTKPAGTNTNIGGAP